MKHWKDKVVQTLDKCTCDICGLDTEINSDDNGTDYCFDGTIEASYDVSGYGECYSNENISIDICYRCITKAFQFIPLLPEKKVEVDYFLNELKEDLLDNI